MNLLAQLNLRHPPLSTAVGVASGAFSCLVAWVEPLTKIFGLLGAGAGALVAILTAAEKVRAWRAARAPFRQPPEEQDDIPL